MPLYLRLYRIIYWDSGKSLNFEHSVRYGEFSLARKSTLLYDEQGNRYRYSHSLTPVYLTLSIQADRKCGPRYFPARTDRGVVTALFTELEG